MSSLRTLKSYNSQIQQLKIESEEVKSKLRDLQRSLTAKQKTIEEIEGKIKSLKQNEGIVVSEHAIIRYLERVYDMDIENIKTLILPQDSFRVIHQLGDGKYPVSEFRIVVKDGVVVTVEK